MAKFKTRTDGSTLSITTVDKVEAIYPYAPVRFEDDFLGDSLSALWTELDTSSSGDTTPAILADGIGGIASVFLDTDDEVEQSGISFGDQRPFGLDKQTIMEMRVRIAVLPTLLAETVFGLAGDTNAVADTIAEGIWFKADGNGAIVCETDDGTTNNDDKATGVTVLATDWKTYRIDCTVPTDIKFFIDGERVSASTTFSANAVPTLALQPYIAINKSGGVGVGTVYVDYVKVWSQR